jgi:transcriptional regulator of arginine metabolism
VSTRAERHRVLRALLAEQELRTHAEVQEALASAGHEAHAATVGRDLEDLGARRVRSAQGQLVYRIEDPLPTPSAPQGLLDEALQRYVLSVVASGNLLVLRTPPACASPVASALDTFGGPAVLGTIAGDDTVIVVIAEGHDPTAVADSLHSRTAAPVAPSEVPDLPRASASPDRSPR